MVLLVKTYEHHYTTRGKWLGIAPCYEVWIVGKDMPSNRIDQELNRLRRKADQAWELAGCARQDGDKADEARWTAEALEYTRLLRIVDADGLTKRIEPV